MSKKFYGSIALETQSALTLLDAASTHSVSLRAPSSVSSNITFQVPGADLTNGAMVSDGSGNLSLALLVNANVSASAAIAYSKLALTGSIVNADINASAAIAYSKLALTGSIVNADIAAGAAIAVSKLAALTASRAVASDGSGFLTASATTSTELGYVSGVTSAIQTQLNGKANTALSNLTVSGLAADDLLVASSSSAVSRLAIGTDGQILTVVSGAPAWAANPAAAVTPFTADWILADGTTKTITHSLGTTDIIVQLFDKTDGTTIDIDTVARTDANTLTLTASQAPGIAGWRVLVLTV
jgi:hypothetical protein